MENKIENYIHLYLGCKIKSVTMGIVSTFNTYNEKSVKHFKDGSFKLVLRPLHNMLEEEFNELSRETSFKGINPMDSDGADDFINRSLRENDWREIIEASNWLRRNGFDLDNLIDSGYAVPEKQN